MKNATVFLALILTLSACSKEFSKDEKAIIDTWIGGAIAYERKDVPEIIILIVEIKSDHTYLSKVKGIVPLLGLSAPIFEESGSWKMEGGRVKIAPNKCQETIDVERGGIGQVACGKKHGMTIKYPETPLEFERYINGNPTTFIMTRL